MTSRRMPAAGLFAVLLVAACAGSAVPGGTSPTGATAQPGATAAQPGGTGEPATQDPGLITGTWSGTMTRHYTETTITTSESDSTSLTVTYDATVKISSTLVDVNAWTLTGPATIKATSSSDYQLHLTTTLGPCNKHYHDEDFAEGGSTVDGGLEIRDDATYEFTMTVPGFEGGTETALRDETGCQGSSNTEVNPWPVGPTNLDGSGEVTDPTTLKGSSSKPIANGGQDTITWDLHLVP